MWVGSGCNPGDCENPEPLEGCSAAIHLSGANLAGRRWTPEYKRGAGGQPGGVDAGAGGAAGRFAASRLGR